MLPPRHWAGLGAFVLALVSAWADGPRAPVTLSELDVAGRRLHKVEVRSYDGTTDRFTLVAGRNLMAVAATDMAPALRDQLKTTVPRKDSPPPKLEPAKATGTLPTSGPRVETKTPPGTGGQTADAPPPANTPSVAKSANSDQERILAYQELILARARKYYADEYPAGSNLRTVKPVEYHLDTVERVTGWNGRYRWEGRVMVDIVEGGGKSRRETDRFEVITEERPGEEPRVIDYFRK